MMDAYLVWYNCILAIGTIDLFFVITLWRRSIIDRHLNVFIDDYINILISHLTPKQIYILDIITVTICLNA